MLAWLFSLCCAGAASPGGWTPAGALPSSQYRPVVVELADGRVAVIGGKGPDRHDAVGEPLAEVSVFDPTTQAWSAGPRMTTGRYQPSATRLADGRVLVAGGIGPAWERLASAEILDPQLDRWTATSSLLAPRESHVAALLGSGEVLVSSGYDEEQDALGTSEIWSPASGAWRAAGSLPAPRAANPQLLARGGSAWLFDGIEGNDTFSLAIYNAATDHWTEGPAAPHRRSGESILQLASGSFVRVGGETDDDPAARDHVGDVFDPVTGAWTEWPARTPDVPVYHCASLLADGRVLAVGGEGAGDGQRAAVWFVDPGSGAVSDGPPLPNPRSHALCATLPDGRVLVIGGWTGGLSGHALFDTLLFTP